MVEQVLQEVVPVPQLSFVVVGAQFARPKVVEASSPHLPPLSSGRVAFLGSCVGGRAYKVPADNVGGYAFTSCDVGHELRPLGAYWQEGSSHYLQRSPATALVSRADSSWVIL